MTIVDTSVWVDFLTGQSNPHTEWLDSRVGTRPIGLTDLNLCEVLQGIRHDSMFRRVQKELGEFVLFDTCGQNLAVTAASNSRKLRSKGLIVRTTVDCVIATLCIESGYRLLHRDPEFDVFEQHMGLQVIHPRTE